MATYAKNYPTLDDARATMTDDEITAAIDDLADYSRKVAVLTLGDEVPMTANFLRAVASFAESVESQLGCQITFSGREFSRVKTDDELRKAVIESRRSDMYYHPEKYGLEVKDKDTL